MLACASRCCLEQQGHAPELLSPPASLCAALQGAAAADTSKLRADLDAALAELKDVKAARSAADKAAKVGRQAGCCLTVIFQGSLGRMHVTSALVDRLPETRSK